MSSVPNHRLEKYVLASNQFVFNGRNAGRTLVNDVSVVNQLVRLFLAPLRGAALCRLFGPKRFNLDAFDAGHPRIAVEPFESQIIYQRAYLRARVCNPGARAARNKSKHRQYKDTLELQGKHSDLSKPPRYFERFSVSTQLNAVHSGAAR